MTVSETTAQVAAVIIAVVNAGFVGAMVYWASGRRRWLHSHWGGFYTELPVRLRIADGVSGTMFGLGIYVALARAWSAGPASIGLLNGLSWAFAALMGTSAIANFASSSRYERFIFAPLAVTLSVLWIAIALSE